MSVEREQRAARAVREAIAGNLGDDGTELVGLFREAHRKASAADERATRIEREANALAAIVADLLDGARVDGVIDDLPHDARRRVLAYRHLSGPLAAVRASDQFGELPKVPPRAAVMRDRVRVIDA